MQIKLRNSEKLKQMHVTVTSFIRVNITKLLTLYSITCLHYVTCVVKCFKGIMIKMLNISSRIKTIKEKKNLVFVWFLIQVRS